MWNCIGMDADNLESTWVQVMAWCHHATNSTWHIPLPISPGQVKLPVGQVGFSNVFLQIIYQPYWKMRNFGSQGSENFGNMKPWTSNYQSHFWPISLPPWGVSRVQWLNHALYRKYIYLLIICIILNAVSDPHHETNSGEIIDEIVIGSVRGNGRDYAEDLNHPGERQNLIFVSG